MNNIKPIIRGESLQLVVVLHGFAMRPSAWYRGPLAVIEEKLPDADVLSPEYTNGIASNTDPYEIVQELLDLIDDAVLARNERGGSYKEIILVGVSLGSLLVRKAYVFARGQTQDGPFNAPMRARAWAGLVTRLVLLAGVNRGWSLKVRPSRMSRGKYLALRTIALVTSPLPIGKLARSVERGAPFVANLRVQWMNLARSPNPPPATIQILGDWDDLVANEDNVDVESGRDFTYLRVGETGHAAIIDFDEPKAGERRRRAFVRALNEPIDKLENEIEFSLNVDRQVGNAVLVMHGIRDYGSWTGQVRQRASEVAVAARMNVVALTPSYDYFPMIPFLLGFARQKHVRWFMDQYTEAVARYPNARVGFIGHSNGTYLLASAMERYAACNFDRVAFAGSVVPRKFPWSRFVTDNRIVAIRNDLATADWVVGIFPRFLEVTNWSDIGGGGFLGFVDNEGNKNQVAFVKGQHGAAIVSANHDSLIRFVLGIDNKPNVDQNLLSDRQCPLVIWLTKYCYLVWALIVAAAIGLGYAAVLLWPWPFGGPWLPLLLYGIILAVVLNSY